MTADTLALLIGSLAMQAIHQIPDSGLNGLPVAKYVAVTAEAPILKNRESLGIDVDAQAALVMDVASGQVLYEKDSHTAYSIASLSKLITAMVVLDAKSNLDESVTMTADDDGHEGKMVIQIGDSLTKRELLDALLIGSVNESANALARTSGGREAFVRAMNKKARSIGMEHAVFFDPSGLDSHNRASAKDIAIALRAALGYSEIRQITEQPRIVLTGRTMKRTYDIKSTNLLLASDLNRKPYHIIAAKTGTLPEAGYCVAQATRDANGHEVIAVILGGASHFSRFQDVKALTYWSFQNFDWPTNTTRSIDLRI